MKACRDENSDKSTCLTRAQFSSEQSRVLLMPKFHYTNFTETSPKLPRDKSPRLVYDLSPTCLGEVSGK